VLILDPLKDPAWRSIGADFLTHDAEKFMAACKINESCTLIVDEAGTFCGQYNKEAFWLATQSRHWGHKSYFLTQRANMVAKNIRDNCSELFAFRTSATDAKLLCEDFTYDELLGVVSLDRGECYHALRFGGVQKINVFVPQKPLDSGENVT
jgi:hypothetical protein